MSKAKHTPAPWRVEVPSDSNGYVNIETGGNGFIGYYGEICEERGKPTEVAMANARLIAASPTLKDTLSSARVVLARMRRSMMAHPDHEVGSEFDDLTTESQILEDEIMELIRRIEG